MLQPANSDSEQEEKGWVKLLLDRLVLSPNLRYGFGEVSKETSGTISKLYCKRYANLLSPMFTYGSLCESPSN